MKTARQIIRERLKPFNIDIDYTILEFLEYGMNEFAIQNLNIAFEKIQNIDSHNPIADSLKVIFEVRSKIK